MNTEELKKLLLEKRDEGKLCFFVFDGTLMSVDIEDFIKQPADGILYDLNRDEVTALTLMDDIKWINNFAVALTIRALKKRIEELERQ